MSGTILTLGENRERQKKSPVWELKKKKRRHRNLYPHREKHKFGIKRENKNDDLVSGATFKKGEKNDATVQWVCHKTFPCRWNWKVSVGGCHKTLLVLFTQWRVCQETFLLKEWGQSWFLHSEGLPGDISFKGVRAELIFTQWRFARRHLKKVRTDWTWLMLLSVRGWCLGCCGGKRESNLVGKEKTDASLQLALHFCTWNEWDRFFLHSFFSCFIFKQLFLSGLPQNYTKGAKFWRIIVRLHFLYLFPLFLRI